MTSAAPAADQPMYTFPLSLVVQLHLTLPSRHLSGWTFLEPGEPLRLLWLMLTTNADISTLRLHAKPSKSPFCRWWLRPPGLGPPRLPRHWGTLLAALLQALWQTPLLRPCCSRHASWCDLGGPGRPCAAGLS